MAYSTISKPSLYFNTKLYAGNGGTNNITGVGFQPDWVWIKKRNVSANHHTFDAVRGVTKVLKQNETDAETTVATTLTSFDSDGFTVGSDTSVNGNLLASWNWKANGSGSSNSDGSITSTVSANTTAGFSIVSYTGTGANATVGHGLGSAPRMVIVKERSGVDAWIVGHSSIGFTKNLLLNATNAEYADSTIWNNTAPTSSVFSVGSSSSSNESGATYIAYCFAEKTGYSRVGAYTGTGSASNGPFIYTGFKPSFAIFKRKSGGDNDWILMDNKRDPHNLMTQTLYPNLNNAEAAVDRCDFLSNGIKLRGTSVAFNASGSPYIYIAFGQSLVGSNNVPCTAR